ncbi:hypothetical protein JX266_007507 [Neoarthrinium moseri]|uniref:uncharacterized protein n=1 Tax=Neoarthrinium moseri TaxID=1658444 RepID=UPI001FDBD404|nr:uncharacterized protein JN550_009000 [Neoarthrinium moseri]KAI1846302.1 hypothetical protein JX266_007507 [Neoarthrinium moseri]KAI1864443.1 hypothetical protein JN550_009000 [Neoarthrinium moseri]
MLPHHIFLSLFSAATFVSSQTTTVVSLFLNSPVPGVSTGGTGYVVEANPTATTYVLDCVKALCVGSKRAEYARVTAAPGYQEYNADNDGTSVHRACSFKGSAEATCVESESTTSSGGSYGTVTYVPVAPISRFTENVFAFPGLQAVLITSGVDKLAGAATATATTPTTGGGASTTGTSQPSSSTNDAASRIETKKLAYSVVAVALLLVCV